MTLKRKIVVESKQIQSYCRGRHWPDVVVRHRRNLILVNFIVSVTGA